MTDELAETALTAESVMKVKLNKKTNIINLLVYLCLIFSLILSIPFCALENNLLVITKWKY